MKPRKRKPCPECGGKLNIIGECLLCEMFATGGTPGGQSPGIWPKTNNPSLAVHRTQIPAVLARNKKHGLNIRYQNDGTPIFDSVRDKAALIKVERQYLGKNLCDYDSGYSDA